VSEDSQGAVSSRFERINCASYEAELMRFETEHVVLRGKRM
jgi:hypothetical protein